MQTIITGGLAIYAICLILNDSYLFKPVRGWFRLLAYKLSPINHIEKFVRLWNDTGDPVLQDEPKEGDEGYREFHQATYGYDLISCSMCCGVWIALALKFLWDAPFWDIVAAYGLSYFLSTQER